MDYATPETVRVGNAMIAKELNNIPKEKVRAVTEQYLHEIENGARDFRF